jgi:plastocyanin
MDLLTGGTMKKHTFTGPGPNSQMKWNDQLMGAGGMITAVLLVLMVMSFPFCTVWAQDISGEPKMDHRVIHILEQEGVFPNVVIAQRGTTIIWINYSHNPAEIIFGQQTKMACGKPVNFSIGKSGGYQSQKLEQGMTASLCFTEKGTYEYQLENRPFGTSDASQKRFKGTVKIY